MKLKETLKNLKIGAFKNLFAFRNLINEPEDCTKNKFLFLISKICSSTRKSHFGLNAFRINDASRIASGHISIEKVTTQSERNLTVIPVTAYFVVMVPSNDDCGWKLKASAQIFLSISGVVDDDATTYPLKGKLAPSIRSSMRSKAAPQWLDYLKIFQTQAGFHSVYAFYKIINI
ncbi:hypothetical protein EGR_07250 [Echinococcus granulosus]|uniref:Uncharacterized protein n=1 Tax=Echinococcus granulosus TaxID=6210 RepID=W6U919_ECHGR|nr:hypothetical protein EGR_07250 [Echinococcus granulosus]EUB57888.1 hypothetical protein EGR_07250 [Echinococcus granulosus]